MPETERKIRRKNPLLKAGRTFLAGSALLTAGAVGGYLARGENDLPTIIPSSPPSVDKREEIKKSWNDTINDISLKNELVNEYFIAKNAFNDFYNYELDINSNNELVKQVNKRKLGFVEEGIQILNKVNQYKPAEYDSESKKATLNRVEFDLKNNYQLVIANALVDELIKLNLDMPGSQLLEIHSNIEDLTWLTKGGPPIDYENNALVLQDTETLVIMSRFYQKIEELGFETVTELKFRRINETDKKRRTADFTNEGDKASVTNKGSGGSIVHEEAHHQSYDQDPDLAQEEFNVNFKKELLAHNLYFKDANLYINPYVRYWGENEMRSPDDILTESYAETITSYFMDGSNFRLRLSELSVKGDPAYFVLKASYEHAKKFFKGEEFTENGHTFNPTKGDLFRIQKIEGMQDFMISSWEKPPYESNNAPVAKLTHYDEVIITEEPIEIATSINGPTKVIKVKQVKYDPSNDTYQALGEEGWIVIGPWLAKELAPYSKPLEAVRP